MAASAHPAGVLTKRRSHRFSHRVPVVLSSVGATPEFYERCETSDVSSHGCQVRSPRKLAAGQKVRLELPDSQRQAEARVASVRPDATATGWEVGLELSEPGNIWGLRFSPHMFPWPADVPLPPVGTAAGPGPGNSAPAPATAEPAGAPRPAALGAREAFRGLQDEHRKEFEARVQETLRQATAQLAKNAQFATETAEISVRELTESARHELEEWLAEQRAELDQKLLRLVEAQGQSVIEDMVAELRQQTRQALVEELARLQKAVEAGLETASDHLTKGKGNKS